MKTFFYSIAADRCGQKCDFKLCPQRYLHKLQNDSKKISICNLGTAIKDQPISWLERPLNGDIIILYAHDITELDQIIEEEKSFEGLKKILVVRDTTGIDGNRYHKLSPRYITQAGRSQEELRAVIDKMRMQFT